MFVRVGPAHVFQSKARLSPCQHLFFCPKGNKRVLVDGVIVQAWCCSVRRHTSH